MEVSSGRHDWLLTQSPAPLSFLEGEEVGGQASNQSLVFLVTSPHPGAIQGLTQSHCIRTKNVPTTHEMTRVLGTLCQELEVKTKHISPVVSQYLSQQPSACYLCHTGPVATLYLSFPTCNWIVLLWALSEMMHVKCWEQCLPCRKSIIIAVDMIG